MGVSHSSGQLSQQEKHFEQREHTEGRLSDWMAPQSYLAVNVHFSSRRRKSDLEGDSRRARGA